MSDNDYKEILLLYSDNVLRFLAKNLQNTEDARDILQDSLITLWNNRTNIPKHKAKSYLFTVAYHNMVNFICYKNIRNQNADTDDCIDNITDCKTSADYETDQLISYAIEQLPQTMRSCLLLKDWEGYTVKEISQILNITEDNVKINLFRARRNLRNIISKQ